MPQQTDVVIGSAGYMVVPGTYQRESDGVAEGRSGRWSQTDFSGGQRRAIQKESNTGWDSEGVIAVAGGTGVETFGATTNATESAIVASALPATTRPALSAIVNDTLWIAIGAHLYRGGSTGATTWTPLTLAHSATTAMQGLCHWGTSLIYTRGNSATMLQYDPSTNTTTAYNSARRGRQIINVAGTPMWINANVAERILDIGISNGVVDTRTLDADILQLGIHQGKLAVATRNAVYLLNGYADTTAGKWIGELDPLMSHGTAGATNDFPFLLSYGNRLYTFLAGAVTEYVPSGSREGWRATPVEGNRCFGACVAGGKLLVSVEARNGAIQLWSFDGTGWWLLWQVDGSGTPLWPTATGGSGNQDAIVFRSGQTNVVLYRLAQRSLTLNTYAASGSYSTALIDAGHRDKLKHWSKVGVTFGTPEYRGQQFSSDTSVWLNVMMSVDGGVTETALGTWQLTDSSMRTASYVFDVPVSTAPSTFLQLSVGWSSVSDWCPVLTGLWAEYELLDLPAKRRKWRFDVVIGEAVVRRDGSVEPRSGHQLVTDLWSAWQTGATVTFRDIDDDLTGFAYNARIVGIAERVARSAESGKRAASVLTLTLIQV